MESQERQLAQLLESLQVTPENVPLRRMVAELLLSINRLSEAEEQGRQALQHDPGDAGCKLVLAKICLQQGKHSMGLVLVEDMLSGPDASAEGWRLHARLLERAGQHDEARASYAKSLEMEPSAGDPELAERLGMDAPSPTPPGPRRAAVSSNGWLGELTGSEGKPESQALDADSFQDDTGVEIERPAIAFDAVGGMEDVKNQVRMKIILPMTNQELYEAYGKKAGGGILLYGPPGCGKTHLARATAGEVDAAFISVGLHDVLDMWIGSSEKKLHELFENARCNAPCVLFFDEVDALAAKRSDMVKHGGRHLINQFLSELDGLDASNDGVLVLAATNAPWHLDAAFRRPGRFDRIIFVPPPDGPAREAILELFLKSKPAENIDTTRLAAKTKGFSGADLRGLLDRVVEQKLEAAMKTGVVAPIRTKDLLAAIKQQRASTQEWLSTARNYALYANEGGIYDDIVEFLKLK